MLTIFEFDEFGMSREGSLNTNIVFKKYFSLLNGFGFLSFQTYSYNEEGDMIAVVQIEIENVLFNYKWGSR